MFWQTHVFSEVCRMLGNTFEFEVSWFSVNHVRNSYLLATHYFG